MKTFTQFFDLTEGPQLTSVKSDPAFVRPGEKFGGFKQRLETEPQTKQDVQDIESHGGERGTYDRDRKLRTLRTNAGSTGVHPEEAPHIRIAKSLRLLGDPEKLQSNTRQIKVDGQPVDYDGTNMAHRRAAFKEFTKGMSGKDRARYRKEGKEFDDQRNEALLSHYGRGFKAPRKNQKVTQEEHDANVKRLRREYAEEQLRIAQEDPNFELQRRDILSPLGLLHDTDAGLEQSEIAVLQDSLSQTVGEAIQKTIGGEQMNFEVNTGTLEALTPMALGENPRYNPKTGKVEHKKGNYKGENRNNLFDRLISNALPWEKLFKNKDDFENFVENYFAGRGDIAGKGIGVGFKQQLILAAANGDDAALNEFFEIFGDDDHNRNLVTTTQRILELYEDQDQDGLLDLAERMDADHEDAFAFMERAGINFDTDTNINDKKSNYTKFAKSGLDDERNQGVGSRSLNPATLPPQIKQYYKDRFGIDDAEWEIMHQATIPFLAKNFADTRPGQNVIEAIERGVENGGISPEMADDIFNMVAIKAAIDKLPKKSDERAHLQKAHNILWQIRAVDNAAKYLRLGGGDILGLAMGMTSPFKKDKEHINSLNYKPVEEGGTGFPGTDHHTNRTLLHPILNTGRGNDSGARGYIDRTTKAPIGRIPPTNEQIADVKDAFSEWQSTADPEDVRRFLKQEGKIRVNGGAAGSRFTKEAQVARNEDDVEEEIDYLMTEYDMPEEIARRMILSGRDEKVGPSLVEKGRSGIQGGRAARLSTRWELQSPEVKRKFRSSDRWNNSLEKAQLEAEIQAQRQGVRYRGGFVPPAQAPTEAGAIDSSQPRGRRRGISR